MGRCSNAHNRRDGLYLSIDKQDGVSRAALMFYDEGEDKLVKLTEWTNTKDLVGTSVQCENCEERHKVDVRIDQDRIKKAQIDDIPAPVFSHGDFLDIRDELSEIDSAGRKLSNKAVSSTKADIRNSPLYNPTRSDGIFALEDGNKAAVVYINEFTGEFQKITEFSEQEYKNEYIGEAYEKIGGSHYIAGRSLPAFSEDEVNISVKEVREKEICKKEDFSDFLMEYEEYQEFLEKTSNPKTVNVHHPAKNKGKKNMSMNDHMKEGLARALASAGTDALVDAFKVLFTDDDEFARMLLNHEDGRDVAVIAMSSVFHKLVQMGDEYVPKADAFQENLGRAGGQAVSEFGRRKIRQIREGDFEQLKRVKDAIVSVGTQYTDDSVSTEQIEGSAIGLLASGLNLEEGELKDLVDNIDKDEVGKLIGNIEEDKQKKEKVTMEPEKETAPMGRDE